MPPTRGMMTLAAALAEYCVHMHEEGVLHLDFSPGNVLWEKDSEGYHFSIVDINRMYFGKVSMEQGCRSFARLWGPKRFLQLLVRGYARLRSFDTQQAEDILMEEKTFLETLPEKTRNGIST